MAAAMSMIPATDRYTRGAAENSSWGMRGMCWKIEIICTGSGSDAPKNRMTTP